jgi:hypothetical protein
LNEVRVNRQRTRSDFAYAIVKLIQVRRSHVQSHALSRLLPVVQFFISGTLGAIGLWQRSQLLSQPLFSGTLGDTTAAFHIWPWPFKLAVTMNLPAFIFGGVFELIDHHLEANISETWECVIALAFVPLLWFWIGRGLDAVGTKAGWVFLTIFFAGCIGAATLPLGYIGFLPVGFLIWAIGIRKLCTLKMASVRMVPPVIP